VGLERLDLLYRGDDNMVYHKYFDAGAWAPSMTDWESLGGNASPSSNLTAVSWGPGRLDLLYRGDDNMVYHIYYDGSWKPLPSPRFPRRRICLILCPFCFESFVDK
jgi:hypothetical protein